MPSQPVVLFSDNFSADPIGSFPGSWNGGGPTVQADPLGFYYHIVQMGASHMWKDLGTLYSSATIYFAFCLNSGTPAPYLCSFANSWPIDDGTHTTRICDLFIEDDMSLSLIGFGGILVGNSGQSGPLINPDGWNYVQVNITIGTYTRSDSVVCATVTCDLGLNGNTLLQGAFKELPGLPIASMYYPSNVFNWWLFNDPNFNGGPIANIYLCELSELNVFPFDFVGSPPVYTVGVSNIFDSQNFIEVAEDPDIGDTSDNNLRVSQSFIELTELPLISSSPLIEWPNLRVSQVFIELMTESGATPGTQGSRVYEA